MEAAYVCPNLLDASHCCLNTVLCLRFPLARDGQDRALEIKLGFKQDLPFSQQVRCD